MKKIFLILFFSFLNISFSVSDIWRWEDVFGFSLRINCLEKEKIILHLPGEEIKKHLDKNSHLAIFCQDEWSFPELIFLVDFEDSKNSLEEILSGITDIFQKLQIQGFEEFFEILIKEKRKRLVIFLCQKDEISENYFNIEEHYIKIFSDYTKKKDQSEIIEKGIKAFFKNKTR